MWQERSVKLDLSARIMVLAVQTAAAMLIEQEGTTMHVDDIHGWVDISGYRLGRSWSGRVSDGLLSKVGRAISCVRQQRLVQGCSIVIDDVKQARESRDDVLR